MKKLFKRMLAMALVAVTLVTAVPTMLYADEIVLTNGSEVEAGAEKVKLSDEYMGLTVSTDNCGFLIATVSGNKLE